MSIATTGTASFGIETYGENYFGRLWATNGVEKCAMRIGSVLAFRRIRATVPRMALLSRSTRDRSGHQCCPEHFLLPPAQQSEY
jgi:hypothetical protein